MTVKVITTLHKDGYDLYGRDHIQTWAKYFPKEWEIIYYSEKHIPELDSRVNIVDFDTVCPEWQDFYSYVKKLYNKNKDNPSRNLNWHLKALRWSFKMFAVMHAMKNSNHRYLVWLDADIFANRSPDVGWIERCLASTAMAAQLEVLKVGNHFETGVLIFDLNHLDSSKIFDWIHLGYVDKKVLDEDKAWDGIWMAKLINNRLPWNNVKLSGRFKHESTWLTHRVGKEKFQETKINERSGRTSEQELLKD
jgi:hypothetical protein